MKMTASQRATIHNAADYIGRAKNFVTDLDDSAKLEKLSEDELDYKLKVLRSYLSIAHGFVKHVCDERKKVKQ